MECRLLGGTGCGVMLCDLEEGLRLSSVGFWGHVIEISSEIVVRRVEGHLSQVCGCGCELTAERAVEIDISTCTLRILTGELPP